MSIQEVNIFLISDSTCITAETMAKSILSQFPDVNMSLYFIRFVNSIARAQAAVQEINDRNRLRKVSAIVFSTIIAPEIRSEFKYIENSLVFNLFDPVLKPISEFLGTEPQYITGKSHGLSDYEAYMHRMEAVNFSLSHDDGQAVQRLDEADVILIGISRTGKTPTCLYLSMHYGIRAANFPITEDDMEAMRLPATLDPYHHKLFALSTEPETLREIREQRRPNSRYASADQCDYEIRQSEALYRKNNIPYLNTVTISVEEISAKIIDALDLTDRVTRS